MKTIAILPGDGIGPEVMNEAKKVLQVIGEKYDRKISYIDALIGGAAWDEYQDHFPEETQKICRESDAILFGSVGGPVDQMHEEKWNGCEKNSILGLRKTFQFNTNLRPVKIYPALKNICPLKDELISSGVDILFIRELVGGIYFGEHKRSEEQGKRAASDLMEYTEDQISIVAHEAFKVAQTRRKKVTSIDKSNVLDCSKLWKEIISEVHSEYPNIELEHLLVDNAAMQIIKNPAQFDVVLTPNMFGDILSDEAAVLPGSLGLMPSASINQEGFVMAEPSGGSAPDIAGKNIANPIAQILSAAMLIRHAFQWEEEAKAIENAVESFINSGNGTGDIVKEESQQVSTSECGDEIIKNLKK